MQKDILDCVKIRQDFPVLNQDDSNNLVYLDSAATTQKPMCVIEKVSDFYKRYNSNVHRSAHSLSAMATENFEHTRLELMKFLNAKSTSEIIFTSGATESINLVANSFARAFLKEGDEVILTEMEHHANIVPWQILQDEIGIKLKFIKLNSNGDLDLDNLDKIFNHKTKLLGVTAMSNALGTINPVKKLISVAHKYNTPVLVDGSQAVAHYRVDVQELDCDFFVCSAHKIYGPTGVGVLYGKESLLEKMPPYQAGGEMIERVTLAKTSFAELPYKFEAGTPNIAGVIGFGAALKYLNRLDWEKVKLHEAELLEYGLNQLKSFSGLKFVGNAKHRGAVISFVFDDIHANDIGTMLDEFGVAVRVGHHCAMPAMRALGVSSTVRVSFAIYNSLSDIDKFIAALRQVVKVFR